MYGEGGGRKKFRRKLERQEGSERKAAREKEKGGEEEGRREVGYKSSKWKVVSAAEDTQWPLDGLIGPQAMS